MAPRLNKALKSTHQKSYQGAEIRLCHELPLVQFLLFRIRNCSALPNWLKLSVRLSGENDIGFYYGCRLLCSAANILYLSN